MFACLDEEELVDKDENVCSSYELAVRVGSGGGAVRGVRFAPLARGQVRNRSS